MATRGRGAGAEEEELEVALAILHLPFLKRVVGTDAMWTDVTHVIVSNRINLPHVLQGTFLMPSPKKKKKNVTLRKEETIRYLFVSFRTTVDVASMISKT